MKVVHTVADVRGARNSSSRGVVMTMGALHDGHASLIRETRRLVGSAGTVIVTDFVNPTQFGVGEDFSQYPRTLDHDVAICAEAGADIVFAPDVVEVYGNASGFLADSITIDPGPLGDILEGAARPGHMRGMLTVVAKLMGLTQPDVACFGEKDYQQLTLIRRMVSDLSMAVEVVGVPTVREADGLAMSSRNRYLSSDERAIASCIPAAVAAVVASAGSGVPQALDAGRAALHPAVELDYLVVTDPKLGPPTPGPGRVLIAARVGTTRLIDNDACIVETP
jgi:pantoate--beta-alanine ligase